MRFLGYVSLEKSIPIVSLGGTCRVLRAHDAAASFLADECFAVFGGSATMRLRRYVSLEKSILIVSLGGTCRVLRAHDTAASSLADDCFAGFGGSATMRLRRYVPLEKFISILKLAGFFLILSRWSGRLILRRFFKAWGGSSLVVVRSRDRATPPTW